MRSGSAHDARQLHFVTCYTAGGKKLIAAASLSLARSFTFGQAGKKAAG